MKLNQRTINQRFFFLFNSPLSSQKVPETVSTEELSVYDLKDHALYKFRPGHLVVRVAASPGDVIDGPLERAAAGQVFSLGVDGRLKVQWADNSTSFCFPQELYLISEEVRNLGSECDH